MSPRRRPFPQDLGFPLFVKPVKSFFSIGAERVDRPRALAALVPRWAALDQFFAPLDEMLQRYAGATIGTKRLIAEGLLKGEQVTVEGFVHGGKATIMGVVDFGDVPRHARLLALRLSFRPA